MAGSPGVKKREEPGQPCYSLGRNGVSFQRCEFSLEDVGFKVPLGHLGGKCLENTVRRLRPILYYYLCYK